jgi:ubiquinone/menaquinone biosynthesis C-methylase UbiE
MKDSVSAEFTRQAKTMAAAPAFHAEAALARLVDAVRSADAGRVLDLACGPGIVAEALSPFVREIVGTDGTPEMIRLARERFAQAHLTNGRFEVAWAESLPFEAGEFDAVTARLLLHHLPNIASVLSEVRRVLRPQVHLIAADVISSDDAAESALQNAWEKRRDPTHVRMLARAEMIGAIRLAGFETVSEATWKQERSFREWAQIVSNPGRTEPLRRAMQASAKMGPRAGIDLREESGELRFTHTWLMVIARAPK